MPRRPRSLAALLAVTLAACSTTSTSPSPTPSATPTAVAPTATAAAPTGSPRPLAEVYGEIRAQVEAIRGLRPTSAVEPVVIDATQLAKNLEVEFDTAYPVAALEDAEDVLITLGLLPPGSSLRALTLAFQAGQVAGYYSPEQDRLFVVSRPSSVGPADESTYAHEFTHQLQDQHIDLDALGIDVLDQGDRSLARLALVEGDATSVQTTWMTRHLTAAELGEVFAAALDPVALEAMRSAPAYLRDTAFFPYQEGAAFVMGLIAKGGYDAVDAAFADPPDSTEQVIHPDKYLSREAPVVVEVPEGIAKQLGVGWSEVGRDTLGEMILRIWLKADRVEAGTQANIGAAGWGGDRLALYRGPGGKTVVVLVTEWDTSDDALEFDAAATAALTAMQKTWTMRRAGQRVALAVGEAGAVEALRGVVNGLVLVPVGS